MLKLKELIYICLLLFASGQQIVLSQSSDTLYIQRINKNISNFSVSLCIFSKSSTPDSSNAFLNFPPLTNHEIVIINNDSVSHQFVIDNIITSDTIIPADTLAVSVTLDEGTYRFYSGISSGNYLGASGIIRCGLNANYNYYWNLFDLEENQNNNLVNGLQSTIVQPYTPEVFTINNNIYPTTALDSLANVKGSVGDSIIISMVNSGIMTHPFHFHGYHVKILDSSISNHMIGWEKDSFPVLPGEAISVLLIPDKPGIFPVHDHNLISVTTGGYPGGMIAIISITP